MDLNLLQVYTIDKSQFKTPEKKTFCKVQFNKAIIIKTKEIRRKQKLLTKKESSASIQETRRYPKIS